MIYSQFMIIDSINCAETVPLLFFLELPVDLSLDPVSEKLLSPAISFWSVLSDK